jgi:hypothetical protein
MLENNHHEITQERKVRPTAEVTSTALRKIRNGGTFVLFGTNSLKEGAK